MGVGSKILVVDDDPTNRLVVRLLMEKRGYEVLEAEGGQAALTIFDQEGADVVLMDLSMPGMDGFEATRRLRADSPAGARVPIIALTAHTTRDEQDRCFENGMNGFLPKPFDSKRAESLLSLLDFESGSGGKPS
ncbi:response regulator [Rhodovulum sp. YNF3179]|uniref:response regulator n=1 Tax=Rhodovulum sp. YNF3179 TaxID=3425127 RepID=UPI003D347071